MCVLCAFTPIFTPEGARPRAGDFSCRYLVRSTPPRQDGAARACRDLPAFWGGSAARDEERPSVYAERSRITNRRYRVGDTPARGFNVSGLNIQLDTFYFEPTSTARLVVARARGARRATSPPQRRVHPTRRGLLVVTTPLVGGPATMTPDMMRGATRRSVKKKVDLEVKHASRLSE